MTAVRGTPNCGVPLMVGVGLLVNVARTTLAVGALVLVVGVDPPSVPVTATRTGRARS